MNTSKKILVIETSMSICYVSVYNIENNIIKLLDGQEYFIHLYPHPTLIKGDHTVFSKIESTISKDNWLYSILYSILDHLQIQKVDYIAVGEGPGSFTALKISHVISKTLSMLWNSSIIPFSSLLFWRTMFLVPEASPFIFPINKNLYYGNLSASESFKALKKEEWVTLLQGTPYVWLEAWTKLNYVTEDIWENSIILKQKDIIPTIPPFLTTELKIQKEVIPWQNLSPIYGHSIL